MFSNARIEIRRRKKENARMKRIMISNKIRFISMKIRLQIQTLFYFLHFLSFWCKFDFGKLNAFAVRWWTYGHPLPHSNRSLSLYLFLPLFVCLLFFLFPQYAKIYIDPAMKRTHNNNNNNSIVSFKKQKQKIRKTFSIKIILAVVITMLLNSPNQNLLEKNFHLNYWAW